MNITRENIDNTSAIVKVLVEKSDYEEAVNKQLKQYRQQAAIPGFRPGKAPAGLIKRKFGTAILVDEVNNILSNKLSQYFVQEKLSILGEPLPNNELQKPINWETDENFEFAFDIAFTPEVNLTIDQNDKINYYNIAVSEERIDEQVEYTARRLGQNVPDDEVRQDSTVRGDFIQVDENGNDVEDGIQTKNVAIAIDRMKDETTKQEFIGKKVGDIVVFDPVKTYENRHEVGHMLNISHEQADQLNSSFRFTINEILKFEKAELNEELFKEMYGENTDVKTIEDFRNRVKEEIASNLKNSSDNKFATDAREALLEKAGLELPEEFLKRWLIAVNKKLTVEQIEKEFPYFIDDLKWQIIRDIIARENNIEVTEEEINEYAKNIARAQYYNYGIFDIPEEQIESFARLILEKSNQKEQIYNGIFDDKVIKAVKEKVTIVEKEVTEEEFDKLMQ